MVTLGNIDPFWDDEYTTLDYQNEEFNNNNDLTRWVYQGYRHGKFTGDMCDMRRPQPSWNDQIIKHFEDKGWSNVCTSYYRMSTATILPVHIDTYKKYIEIFNLKGKEDSIQRALIFLEDWQSGHYLEVDGHAITKWQRGNYVVWSRSTPHMAANIGLTPRYTLQVTGSHVS